MKLASFITHVKSNALEYPVVSLQADTDYPLLFFSRLLLYLKKKHMLSLQKIDVATSSLQQMRAQLETSFLGQKTVYWLGNISVLSSKEQTSLIAYCGQYAGPNNIWLFTQKAVKELGLVVEIPTSIDKRMFTDLMTCLDAPITIHSASFIKKLYYHQSGIDLDMASVLFEYMYVLGEDTTTFFDDHLPLMLPSEKSLFDLATYFLSKQSNRFYTQWHELQLLYSEQFWISYFSELLWRGAHYIEYARKGDMVSARKIAYRLPFSFTKSGWHNGSSKELSAAHAFLYHADFTIKNGNGYGALDVFCSAYFIGQFTKQT